MIMGLFTWLLFFPIIVGLLFFSGAALLTVNYIGTEECYEKSNVTVRCFGYEKGEFFVNETDGIRYCIQEVCVSGVVT